MIDAATSQPIAGARLNFHGRGRRFERRISDSRGGFVFEGVSPGQGELKVESESYGSATLDAYPDQRAPLTIPLRRRITASGQILDSDGMTPVGGEVHILLGDLDSVLPTDAQGRFSLTDLDPATRISASTRSGVSAPQELHSLNAEQLRSIRLVLVPAPIILGNVSGVALDQMSRVDITVNRLERTDSSLTPLRPESLQIHPDPTGAFRVPGLAPGIHLIRAQIGTQQTDELINVPEAGEVVANFDFGGLQIRGRVTHAGRPAAGIEVTAGGPRAASAVTSESGDYELGALPAGEYQVSVRDLAPVSVTLPGRAVQNLELPPHGLSGRVLAGATGRPLPGAEAQLHSLGAFDIRHTNTLSEGAFSFIGLTAGDYLLTVLCPGYDVSQQRLHLPATPGDLEVTLQPNKGVALRLNSSTADVEEAMVMVQDDGELTFVLELRTDENGAARLPPSLVGQTLEIITRGHRPYVISEWSGMPLDIELQPLTK